MILGKVRIYTRQNWLMTGFVLLASVLLATQSTVSFAHAQVASSNAQTDLSSLLKNITATINTQLADQTSAFTAIGGTSSLGQTPVTNKDGSAHTMADCGLPKQLTDQTTKDATTQTNTLAGFASQVKSVTTPAQANDLAKKVDANSDAAQISTTKDLAISDVCTQKDGLKTLTALKDKIQSQFDQQQKCAASSAGSTASSGANSSGSNTSTGSSTSGSSTSTGTDAAASDCPAGSDSSGGGGGKGIDLQQIIQAVVSLITSIAAIIASVIALIIAIQAGDWAAALGIFTVILAELQTSAQTITQAITTLLGGSGGSGGASASFQVGGSSSIGTDTSKSNGTNGSSGNCTTNVQQIGSVQVGGQSCL